MKILNIYHHPSVKRAWIGLSFAGVLAFLGLHGSASAGKSSLPADEPAEVQVNLAAHPHPVLVGQPVDLQVRVSAQVPQIPGGEVEIFSDAQQSCLTGLDAQGQGSCSMTFSTPGRVVLRAQYLGETAFLPGVSAKLLLPIVSPGDLLIYQHDFETPVGPEWNSPQRETAPNAENFLGQFNNETIHLNLEQLPAHHWAQVTFDLYIIRSWDGNLVQHPDLHFFSSTETSDENLGPDRWFFQGGGLTYLDTTFGNWGGWRQAFPGMLGVGDYPALTGAQDLNHLGYTFGPYPMDATYRLSYRFVHSKNSLTLNFGAIGLQSIEDESWGLDNLSVIVNDAPAYQIFLPVISKE